MIRAVNLRRSEQASSNAEDVVAVTPLEEGPEPSAMRTGICGLLAQLELHSYEQRPPPEEPP